MEVAGVFERDRYVVLPSMLVEPALLMLYRYARGLAATGAMLSGDELVPDTPCAYSDPMMDGLLTKLLPQVERVSALELFPTCSYLRVYKKGDTLKKHRDRAACEISVTLCLGYDAPAPWPIWIEGPAGVNSVNLRAGDGLIYRGAECPHWRTAFEGCLLAQVFLHYVDQYGPHAEWKFDKRSSLTNLRTFKRHETE